jgi:hypothetical protein
MYVCVGRVCVCVCVRVMQVRAHTSMSVVQHSTMQSSLSAGVLNAFILCSAFWAAGHGSSPRDSLRIYYTRARGQVQQDRGVEE